MPNYPLSGVTIPIQDVKDINNLWCAYEHHVPPAIVYVNACRLVDVFRLKDARDNSEWFKLFSDGGGLIISLLIVTDDRNEAMRVAIERCKALPAMPRCNLHGWNMNRAGRPIICSNGETYASQSEAAQALSLPQGNISRHLRGELRSVGGYTFAFAKEEMAP